MKKIALFMLSLILLNLSFQTLAIEKKQDTNTQKKEKITNIKISIENWKKKKRQLIKQIYEQTNISSLMDLTTAATQLKEISDSLKTINLSYNSVKLQKKNIDKKHSEVLKQARSILIQLNQKNNDLKKTLFKIQVLSKELEDIRHQIQEIKDTIFISKKQVEKYIAILYKINNDYYTSFEKIDDIKLLIKSNNIAKTLSQEDILKILSLKTQELLDTLEDRQKRKKEYLRKLYSKRAEYINLVNDYKSQVEILESKKKFLADLLTMLRSNKKQVDELYKRFAKRRYSLKKQQIKIAKDMKKTLSGDSLWVKPIDLSEVLQHTIKNDGDKFLNWPSRDYHKITAYFHDENYYKRFWFEHDWIDIFMPQGSDVYASAAGYVYKVVDNDNDYYNFIVLVHNYGYVTIYGHVSKSLVKEWEFVKRWQIIAKSWWTPWTRWAWKLSTWPHLHFEVRKNWQLIDPLSVMDLSVYLTKKELPVIWQIKYLKDKITRKIDLSNVKFYPKSRDEKKRITLFLKVKAAPWFKNATWWIQMWEKLWIDPAVAVCVWYAESWLWWNLSSQNNVWNVWNNDRWDRRGYPTPQAWINAIYYALNNKYLSKYHTIYSLSRYWNKDSHIYSSSSYNWYKNMIKCLSMLKWYPVDEYYPFRVVGER